MSPLADDRDTADTLLWKRKSQTYFLPEALGPFRGVLIKELKESDTRFRGP